MTEQKEYDLDLVKVVHREALPQDCELTAIIDRFGGLSVFIFLPDDTSIYQGDNILVARKWFYRNLIHLAQMPDNPS